MKWKGKVVSSETGSAHINVDLRGSSDLVVDFADEKIGYDLIEGQWITVRFVMKSMGGCFVPFIGKYAEREVKSSMKIVKPRGIESVKPRTSR